jgi:cysteine desulfurase/selenocysteine lyase
MLRQARSGHSPSAGTSAGTPGDFGYLAAGELYFDSACQTLRPQPVLDALTAYYTEYNACGGRVKYAWGRRVDEEVATTRAAVLRLFGASARSHAVSFTLNTTYGINLLLLQLPMGRFSRVVTSTSEHNSVALPTMTAARRLGIDRVVLERDRDGALLYAPADLERAVVVVASTSNVDGRGLPNLADLIRDAHERGGIVLVDAAQTMAHGSSVLHGTDADAICFSAHKMYGASLGVVVASRELLRSLQTSFVGGGMVADVREDSFDLVVGDEQSLLEPGLQPWAEIIALGAAIDWLATVRPFGRTPGEHMAALERTLFTELAGVDGVEILGDAPAAVVSVHVPGVDSHRLAVFLSQQHVSVRSGYFCAHQRLKNELALPPLLRFSLGLHLSEDDVTTTTAAFARLVKGLA